jgi:hypothetical protein
MADQTQQPGLWRQNIDTHDAADYRRLLRSVLSEGVTQTNPTDPTTDLKVIERSPNGPGVWVTEGGGVIEGDDTDDQGAYYGYSLDHSTVDVDAGDATNPRRDRIIMESLDTFYGSGSDVWRFRAVKGTPSPTPALPALPSNAISLAEVHVAALQVNIAAADITDLRTPAVSKAKAIWGRAYLGADHSITSGTVAVIHLDTPEEDPYGMFDAVNHWFKIPAGLGGIWIPFGQIMWDNIVTGVYRQSRIQINGASYTGRTILPPLAGTGVNLVLPPIGVPVRLADLDTVALLGAHDRGTPLVAKAGAGDTYLSLVRIGG